MAQCNIEMGDIEEEEMLIEEGSIIDDCWEIGKVIDRGTFSTLYFTKNLRDIKAPTYCVKVVIHGNSDSTCTDDNLIDNGNPGKGVSSKLESKVWKQLQGHPNIATLTNVSNMKINDNMNATFFFQPFYSGGTLYHLLLKDKSTNTINEKQIAHWYYQLIQALSHCHKNFIVHHDIKLENVLLTDDKTIKLIDFGFCWEVNRDASVDIEYGGLVNRFCGSEAYLAPEILNSSDGYLGFPVDIWASGVILFALLQQRFPFAADDPQLLYEQATDSEFITDLLSSFNDNTDLFDLFSRIFELDPKKRITANEILQHSWFRNIL